MELFVSLEPEDVEKIAHLARLRIEAQNIPGYARNLSEILALVERMNSIDTQGVQPMAHPQDIHQRLRADEITESDQRDRFQKNAPQTEAGLYLVPKVIE
jgi:aspartyl-tRNA(Asn)/glutamyl-tRNA(Gln) amidotransferase subunit C